MADQHDAPAPEPQDQPTPVPADTAATEPTPVEDTTVEVSAAPAEAAAEPAEASVVDVPGTPEVVETQTEAGKEDDNAADADAAPAAQVIEMSPLSTPTEARDTAAIKAAYEQRDVEASKAAHDGGYTALATEKHKRGGDFLKSVVYGAMDGIQTTFAVIAGAAGGGLSVGVILILGFSNLLADGLSMGIGDAVSEHAEIRYIRSERKREKWEYDNYKEGEVSEMEDLFQEKGMNSDDAKRVIGIMAKYPEYFVDLMMSQELELQVPDDDENPWCNGLVTFCSFVVFGFAPLLVYVIFAGLGWSYNLLFGIAIAVTAVALIILGVLKASFGVQKWWWSAIEMLFTGTATAAASYGIAFAVQAILGSEVCV